MPSIRYPLIPVIRTLGGGEENTHMCQADTISITGLMVRRGSTAGSLGVRLPLSCT